MKQSSNDQGAFRILCDNYVTSDSGTGVVHQAPGFGEVSIDDVMDHVRSHECSHTHRMTSECVHIMVSSREMRRWCVQWMRLDASLMK